MSLKTRTLIFVTFFGNCVIVGLLVASLTTENWINADGKRINATDSKGKVKFGLFSGQKGLNIGYGWRNETIDVVSFIRTEPDSMNFMLWIGTAIGAGLALFSSAIGAVASVLKAASAERKRGTVILLFISNLTSALSQILAFVCWLIQFYQYLTHNVFTAEDRGHLWNSKNNASLGHSFFFIVIGCIIACLNVILILLVMSLEKRERRIEPPCDEKAQGAIMLY